MTTVLESSFNNSPDTNTSNDNAQNIVCSISEPVLEILNVNEASELSLETLESKLKILNEIDSDTFFCGDASKIINNGGLHIWYINNYNSIKLSSKSLNTDIQETANRILNILEKFVKDGIDDDSIADLNLRPFTIDMSIEMNRPAFFHGFRFFYRKINEDYDVFSAQSFPKDI